MGELRAARSMFPASTMTNLAIIAICCIFVAAKAQTQLQAPPSQNVEAIKVQGSTNTARLPCGRSCSSQTQILTWMDGEWTSSTCSQLGTNARCDGCCKAKALENNLPTSAAVGSLSRTGCNCCINNFNCPVVAIAPGPQITSTNNRGK